MALVVAACSHSFSAWLAGTALCASDPVVRPMMMQRIATARNGGNVLMDRIASVIERSGSLRVETDESNMAFWLRRGPQRLPVPERARSWFLDACKWWRRRESN